MFVWQEGKVMYVDLAGDASYLARASLELSPIPYRQIMLEIGDTIVLPDSTRITLKAVVD